MKEYILAAIAIVLVGSVYIYNADNTSTRYGTYAYHTYTSPEKHISVELPEWLRYDEEQSVEFDEGGLVIFSIEPHKAVGQYEGNEISVQYSDIYDPIAEFVMLFGLEEPFVETLESPDERKKFFEETCAFLVNGTFDSIHELRVIECYSTTSDMLVIANEKQLFSGANTEISYTHIHVSDQIPGIVIGSFVTTGDPDQFIKLTLSDLVSSLQTL